MAHRVISNRLLVLIVPREFCKAPIVNLHDFATRIERNMKGVEACTLAFIAHNGI